jgi:hypothetical protein
MSDDASKVGHKRFPAPVKWHTLLETWLKTEAAAS